MSVFEIAAFLVGLSAIFGYLNYRFLKLPHTIGLLLIALVASLALIVIELLSPQTDLLEIVTSILQQIGLEVLVVAQRFDHVGVALLLIPVTLAARWVSVFIPISISERWTTFTRGAVPVLTWGGLRGGIAVALALSLPANEYKASILTITYAVVLFSIIVQGLTIKPLIERVVARGQLE